MIGQKTNQQSKFINNKEYKMELEDAHAIIEGRGQVENISVAEGMQLMMGACLTDDGDIICLKCGLPNECCLCEI